MQQTVDNIFDAMELSSEAYKKDFQTVSRVLRTKTQWSQLDVEEITDLVLTRLSREYHKTVNSLSDDQIVDIAIGLST